MQVAARTERDGKQDKKEFLLNDRVKEHCSFSPLQHVAHPHCIPWCLQQPCAQGVENTMQNKRGRKYKRKMEDKVKRFNA